MPLVSKQVKLAAGSSALAIFISLAVLHSVSFADSAGRVEGRVMFMDRPMDGASVYAYKEPDGLFMKPPAAEPVVTDVDGRFVMELPKGNYFVAARKKGTGSATVGLEPGDFYSFYGGNPVVTDPARPARLTLNMVVKPLPKDDEVREGQHGGVEGTVTFNGEPLDGVTIYVYLDSNDSFRGMGYYMSPPTGVDGLFRLKMSEGTYYIIARKRLGGSLAGPLREGDYFGYLDTNPVVIRKGVYSQVELPMVRKVEKASPGGQGRTALSGVVKDAKGAPVQGAYACLYKKPDMVDRPAFISKPTGPDGRFEVEVPLGGTFYVGARDTIGGPVEPGQLWGRYSGSRDHSVAVETGKSVEGLEVVVEKVE